MWKKEARSYKPLEATRGEWICTYNVLIEMLDSDLEDETIRGVYFFRFWEVSFAETSTSTWSLVPQFIVIVVYLQMYLSFFKKSSQVNKLLTYEGRRNFQFFLVPNFLIHSLFSRFFTISVNFISLEILFYVSTCIYCNTEVTLISSNWWFLLF